jgi:hypothetical protein
MHTPTDNDPGETWTGTYAQHGSARPLGKGTGRRGNVPPDACHSTGFDPLAGWLELGRPSRTNRQPKREWRRGRR